MLTIKGIYGREMYETWYKMTVMLQSGLDISPGHHPPLPLQRVREGLRTVAASGESGKVVCCDWEHVMFDSSARPVRSGELDEIRAAGLVQGRARDHLAAGRARRRSPTGASVLNFCANNYLGLADHPAVIAAAHEALDAGATAWRRCASSAARRTSTRSSRSASAAFLGTEDTILYSSCFDANGGLFETLLGERGRDHLRRAQPRLDHRRHPALQGRALPLREQRHGRARGSACARRRTRAAG